MCLNLTISKLEWTINYKQVQSFSHFDYSLAGAQSLDLSISEALKIELAIVEPKPKPHVYMNSWELNWKSAGPLHSPIHLSLLQVNGTLSCPPSFPALIFFKPSRPRCTDTLLIYFSFSSEMQGSFEIHRDCIFLVCPLSH